MIPSQFFIDHHLLAGISLAGIICDVMGGLYLAYDLLGGWHGPLRIITRAVTYMIYFIIGYSLFLGPVFGLVAGTGLGLALAIEFGNISSTSTLSSKPASEGLPYDSPAAPSSPSAPSVQSSSPVLLQNACHRLSRRPLWFAVFRGASFGLAATLAFGWRFGLPFGILSATGLVFVYLLGFSPSREHQAVSKPRFRRRPFIASAFRGLSTGTAGALAGIIASRGLAALLFGLEVGLVVGLMSALVSIFSPFVEWWADNLPPRRLGAFGSMLLILGLILQSIQYWVALIDIPVH